ncbi:hypothetical protein SAMN05216378_2485 [Paenibacillus catalpae]|uniref:DUF5325 family protein n=1 Tax=Paenibacillus catalpae TaxID=1045775 RepID=A0A1I1Y917_9BACL|nr:DUF5325 family protein [Paenibacillus catalpae]SFE14623.1 hypothetical protein SAMN05216378_2485 [Paenibacillus catalpae]
MSKPLSLLFAVVSVLLMCATAISMSFNAWLAILFGILTLCMIGGGFVVKARLRRQNENKG